MNQGLAYDLLETRSKDIGEVEAAYQRRKENLRVQFRSGKISEDEFRAAVQAIDVAREFLISRKEGRPIRSDAPPVVPPNESAETPSSMPSGSVRRPPAPEWIPSGGPGIPLVRSEGDRQREQAETTKTMDPEPPPQPKQQPPSEPIQSPVVPASERLGAALSLPVPPVPAQQQSSFGYAPPSGPGSVPQLEQQQLSQPAPQWTVSSFWWAMGALAVVILFVCLIGRILSASPPSSSSSEVVHGSLSKEERDFYEKQWEDANKDPNMHYPAPEATPTPLEARRAEPLSARPSDAEASVAMNRLQEALGKPHVRGGVRYDPRTDTYNWIGPKFGRHMSEPASQFLSEVGPYLY